MPQSLSAVYIHLVFSTKNRQPFLRDKHLREDLHSFLGGTTKTLRVSTANRWRRRRPRPFYSLGLEERSHRLKELKRVSNLWLKDECGLANFEWQAGYADFSVSQSNLEQVKRYIANQEKHHRKISFQDEVRALLTKHKMEWDERYIWD